MASWFGGCGWLIETELSEIETVQDGDCVPQLCEGECGVRNPSLYPGGVPMIPTSTMRNLGMILNASLVMESQVTTPQTLPDLHSIIFGKSGN